MIQDMRRSASAETIHSIAMSGANRHSVAKTFQTVYQGSAAVSMKAYDIKAVLLKYEEECAELFWGPAIRAFGPRKLEQH
jgi:hypothetical protein